MSQSGGARDRDHRGGRTAGRWAVVVCVGWQQGRPVGSNDFLQYWEQDPETDVALMYLESFGNPRKFARVAPRFARGKPLLAVKSGSSAAGARATSSHTGALLSASDVTVDALFEQAGVIRTDTLHDLFGVAELLTTQPVPRGERVAIVTNAGGPGDHVRRRLPGRRRQGARSWRPRCKRKLAEFLAPVAVARQSDRHDRDGVGGRLPQDDARR